MAEQLTILLAGMLAADPHQGGATWAVLQYGLGLQRLGHQVYVVDPLPPRALDRSDGRPRPEIIDYFAAVSTAFGLQQRAALLLPDGRQSIGLPFDALRHVARRADLLINISGLLSDPELIGAIPVRLFLDLDPAFNQLWHSVEGLDLHFEGHTHFATVGLALGQPDCPVPTCGHDWITTLPPIVLERWPVATEPPRYDLTTVGNWRAYGSISHDGAFYGQKAHSLRPMFDLPRRTTRHFEVALAIHPDEARDLAALAANGWCLLDPTIVARGPTCFQRFVQSSWAEFGLAKSGYVVARCGWFSDRSVCYLASGRPVIAQETGFSHYLPTGEGLLTFSDAADVVAAIARLSADYPRHARAARDLAVGLFDSDRVLGRLLTKLGLAA